MESGEQDVVGSPKRLYLATLIANLLFISTGCVMSWTSPTFPKLNGVFTKSEESWVGSLFSLGAMFGPVIIAFGIDRIGRKGTIYILAFCFLLSWIILSMSVNIYVLYIGRIVGGIGVGGSFTSVAVFIAEIADNKRRGALGSFNQFFIAIGFLIEYCIGPYVSYVVLILISGLMVILFYILFFFIPESPYYLLAKGKREKAIDSLAWYRGNLTPEQVEQELDTIEKTITVPKNIFGAVRMLLTKKGPLKALLICFYLLVLQQGSAFNAIIVFAQSLFQMTNMQLHASISAMIIGFTNFLAAAPAPFLVRRFGLRKILLISGFGMGVCLGLLGLYFFLQEEKYDVSSLDFLPVTSLIAFNIFFCCGLGPLPWAVVAEMFPLEVKSVAAALCGMFSSLVGFGVIKGFGVFLSGSGGASVFTTLCIFVIIGSLGGIIILPETKGMTLAEIQEFLDSGQSKNIEVTR